MYDPIYVLHSLWQLAYERGALFECGPFVRVMTIHFQHVSGKLQEPPRPRLLIFCQSQSMMLSMVTEGRVGIIRPRKSFQKHEINGRVGPLAYLLVSERGSKRPSS